MHLKHAIISSTHLCVSLFNLTKNKKCCDKENVITLRVIVNRPLFLQQNLLNV